MKSRTWLVAVIAWLVFGAVGLVLQVVLSPASYNSLADLGTWLLVAAFIVVALLIASVAGRKRRILAEVTRDHSGSLVQLASVLYENGDIVTAAVVVDQEGMGFSSRGGSLRRVSWSSVTSIRTGTWRGTLRTDLEVGIEGEILRLIPFSSWTLFPISEGRSAVFFDAVRTAWRSHASNPASRPLPDAAAGQHGE